MDAFKFMCKRMLDEEDTNVLADDSKLRGNCEGASKKRKTSDDPLGTSNAPLTIEALPKGDGYNSKIDKMVKELEDLIKSNMIPSVGIVDFTSQQVAAPQQSVKSEEQGTLLNKTLQQLAVPKESLQPIHKPFQQVGMPEQIVQPMRQGTLQNQLLQHIAMSKQTVQSVRQCTLPNQSFQQAAMPKQIVQPIRQNLLSNQPLQKVPNQIIQAAQQYTSANQSIRNEVAKLEKREPQSFEVLSWEPRAFLYHNFLSKEECEHLIKMATPHLKRSLLRDRVTGNGKVSSSRTSFGASLGRGSDEIIRNIEKRIAEATFIPKEHGEPLHVLRYEVGQKIEPHHDYFDGLNLNFTDYKSWGQRLATFLMYMSPAEEGGETIFPLGKGNVSSVEWQDGAVHQIRSGVVVKPKMGDAVLFWSVKPDGTLDPSSLHSGCPVIKGNKWCCTKFMRAKEIKF